MKMLRSWVPKKLNMTMLQSFYGMSAPPSLRYSFQWGSVCFATRSQAKKDKQSFSKRGFIGKMIGQESNFAPNRFLVMDKNDEVHRPRNVKVLDGIFDYHDVEDGFLSGRNEDLGAKMKQALSPAP